MPSRGQAIRIAGVCVCMFGCGTEAPTTAVAAAETTDATPGVHAPACADDMWYPSTREALSKTVDALLEKAAGAPLAGRVRAMVSPHAGISYSGLAAACNYRLLRGQTYDRVIVLGPSHRVRFHGISAARYSHYETPLGRVPVDLAVVDDLLRHRPFSFVPAAHAREHSVEIQLPFLQRVLGY